jgi:hypothetical protein
MKKSTSSISCFTSLLTLLITGSVFAPLASQASEASVGYQYDMRGHVVRKANGNVSGHRSGVRPLPLQSVTRKSSLAVKTWYLSGKKRRR